MRYFYGLLPTSQSLADYYFLVYLHKCEIRDHNKHLRSMNTDLGHGYSTT